MDDIAIPYERNLKTKLMRVHDDDGAVTDESHEDVCPGCNAPIVWERECCEWIEEKGNWIPNLWNSWHSLCEECGGYFIAPSDDGLVFYISDYENIEDA